jgi:hypothetical protein
MKATRAAHAQRNIDVSNLSIPDAEEIIEEALTELSFSQDPGLSRALRFLAPPGYQAIVELCSENGRSKRRPVIEHHSDHDEGQEVLIPGDLDIRVKELCSALAEAERGGHAFIALKWFRDSFLPRKAFRWNQNPESRQSILAEAIQRGVVLTSKIANPKTPAYPTTTIRLNRAEAGIPEEAQRFHPVPIQGETLAAVIDEERGAM